MHPSAKATKRFFKNRQIASIENLKIKKGKRDCEESKRGK
ncbi:hypothetical protein CSC35_4737 [Enterobacter hormaechei]|nr:hypothetical protein CSC35_4737 [Enterobacter hormaechei]